MTGGYMMFVELGRPENKMTLSEAIKAVTKDYNNKTDGWIQSNKQLPDKDGKYITTSTDGKVDVIWYSTTYGWFGWDDVLAWMPLPDPYNIKGM